MPTLSEDTTPQMERVLIQKLREMRTARKIELLGEMIETVNTLALSGLRTRYPGEPPERLRRRLAALLFGKDVAERIWGPMPGKT